MFSTPGSFPAFAMHEKYRVAMVSKRELVNVGELGLIEVSKNASSSMGLKALPFANVCLLKSAG